MMVKSKLDNMMEKVMTAAMKEPDISKELIEAKARREANREKRWGFRAKILAQGNEMNKDIQIKKRDKGGEGEDYDDKEGDGMDI